VPAPHHDARALAPDCSYALAPPGWHQPKWSRGLKALAIDNAAHPLAQEISSTSRKPRPRAPHALLTFVSLGRWFVLLPRERLNPRQSLACPACPECPHAGWTMPAPTRSPSQTNRRRRANLSAPAVAGNERVVTKEGVQIV
jgi:hypothetical protein